MLGKLHRLHDACKRRNKNVIKRDDWQIASLNAADQMEVKHFFLRVIIIHGLFLIHSKLLPLSLTFGILITSFFPSHFKFIRFIIVIAMASSRCPSFYHYPHCKCAGDLELFGIFLASDSDPLVLNISMFHFVFFIFLFVLLFKSYSPKRFSLLYIFSYLFIFTFFLFFKPFFPYSLSLAFYQNLLLLLFLLLFFENC